MLLNFLKSFFGLVRIIFILVDLLLEHLDLVFETFDQIFFTSLGQIAPFLDFLNLVLNLFIGLFELVELSIEHIDVILQAVILLFGLDKSGNDFLNIRNTRGLLDLVKGVFNDLHVTQVLVHQFSFLLIGLNDLVESPFSNHDRIGEASGFISTVLTSFLIKIFIIKFKNFFFFLQFQLQFLNNIFKFFFFLLILNLEDNNLIIGLLNNTGNQLIIFILDFSVFLQLFNLFFIRFYLVFNFI